MTNVLVTGGTGFVGSHLVELLLSKGYIVTCLVRDQNRLRWLRGLNVRLVQGDCTEPASLAAAVRGVSVVFHVSGLTKALHASDYYAVNHLGTGNLLEACVRHNPGLRRFVFISSQAAAGPSRDGIPVKPADPPHPVSDYGSSKLKAEEETLGYKERFPVVILRPSAVYGPRDRDMFELFRWAVRGVTLEIAGGERFVNLCYVGDLVSAMERAVQADTPSGSIYFIAEHRPYSWSEFRTALLSAGKVRSLNLRIPYAAAYGIGLASEFASLLTQRPAITSRQKVLEASQRYWLCDTRLTEQELGFTEYHALPRGLALTWQWYREQKWL